VQGIVNGVTIKYVGAHYEVEGTTVRKYYYAGGVRVAMRTGTGNPNYFLTDHLGSTTVTLTNTGAKEAELRYSAWGMSRFTFGNTPTSFQYTGQRIELDIYFYGARYYDQRLGRFLSADSIVPGPGNPLAWDRYAGMMNNPVRYNDPSGHSATDDCGPDNIRCGGIKDPKMPFMFEKLPVNEEDIDWVGWYGGTEYAHTDHEKYQTGKDNYNYDGYCQGYHCGIDIGGGWGDPIMAGVNGQVVVYWSAGSNGGWKLALLVDGYIVRYEHLSSINPNLQLNQIVSPDTVIGFMGNPTNTRGNGNYHLHLEVRFNSTGLNGPNDYRDRAVNPLTHFTGENINVLVSVAVNQSSIATVTFHPDSLVNSPVQLFYITLGGPVLWP
jgi:RHS repeat-associated protein